MFKFIKKFFAEPTLEELEESLRYKKEKLRVMTFAFSGNKVNFYHIE